MEKQQQIKSFIKLIGLDEVLFFCSVFVALVCSLVRRNVELLPKGSWRCIGYLMTWGRMTAELMPVPFGSPVEVNDFKDPDDSFSFAIKTFTLRRFIRSFSGL